MNARSSQPSNEASGAQLNDAIAALIASTRRVNRKLNLLEVADKLRTAQALLGSLSAVASAIGLSDEMVRQFSRVEKLSPEVKRFLADGQITAVDVADRISRLPGRDQLPVAKSVAAGDLNSADVRAIISLRKSDPRMPISRAIAQVIRSRNVKEYIVEFVLPDQPVTIEALRGKFTSAIGKQNILSVTAQGKVGRIVITEKGKSILADAAREAGVTKSELVRQLLGREVK